MPASTPSACAPRGRGRKPSRRNAAFDFASRPPGRPRQRGRGTANAVPSSRRPPAPARQNAARRPHALTSVRASPSGVPAESPGADRRRSEQTRTRGFRPLRSKAPRAVRRARDDDGFPVAAVARTRLPRDRLKTQTRPFARRSSGEKTVSRKTLAIATRTNSTSEVIIVETHARRDGRSTGSRRPRRKPLVKHNY